MTQFLKKSISTAVSAALMALSAGVAPYEALAQIRTAPAAAPVGTGVGLAASPLAAPGAAAAPLALSPLELPGLGLPSAGLNAAPSEGLRGSEAAVQAAPAPSIRNVEAAPAERGAELRRTGAVLKAPAVSLPAAQRTRGASLQGAAAGFEGAVRSVGKAVEKGDAGAAAGTLSAAFDSDSVRTGSVAAPERQGALGSLARRARASAPSFAMAQAGLNSGPVGKDTGEDPAARKRPGETLEQAVERRTRILEGTFAGQRWLLVSFAMYYSLFAPVANAIGGSAATGTGRSGYAGALAVLGPITGVLVERMPVRRVLVASHLTRAAIWVLAVPTAWFMLSGAPLLAAFGVLMFLDGSVVAFNHLVDIDAGGMDMLSQQHHFPLDDATRNEYNSRLDGFYSKTRFILPPIFAALAFFAAGALQSASLALVIVMALAFGIPAIMAAQNYLRAIPADADMGPAREQKGVLEAMKQVGRDFKEGLSLSWKNSKIRWRMIFWSLERSLEDAMLMVVLAEVAINLLAKGDVALGALFTTVLIGIGKVGGIVAAKRMRTHWKAPQPGESKYPAYKGFFGAAMRGTLAVGLLPLAGLAYAAWGIVPAAILAATGAVFFEYYFSKARIGFQNLFQGIARESGAPGRIFGISNTFVMGANALAIMGLSAMYAFLGIQAALWASAALFIAVGLFEVLGGPKLLFSAEERAADQPKGPPSAGLKAADDGPSRARRVHYGPSAAFGMLAGMGLAVPLMFGAAYAGFGSAAIYAILAVMPFAGIAAGLGYARLGASRSAGSQAARPESTVSPLGPEDRGS